MSTSSVLSGKATGRKKDNRRRYCPHGVCSLVSYTNTKQLIASLPVWSILPKQEADAEGVAGLLQETECKQGWELRRQRERNHAEVSYLAALFPHGQGRAVGSRLSLPSPALQGIADCSNPWSLTLKFLRRGLAEVVCSARSDDAQSSALHQSEGGAKGGGRKDGRGREERRGGFM